MTEVWLLVDYSGKSVLGSTTDSDKDVVLLINPVVIAELADPRAGQVHFQVAPMMHTFDIKELYVRWSMKTKADDSMKAAYDDYLRRISAKRNANIEVVGSLRQVGISS